MKPSFRILDQLILRSSLKYLGFSAAVSLVLLVAVLYLTGCSALTAGRPAKGPNTPLPAEETRALALLSRLQTRNHTLKSFKGIGHIRVWHRKKMQVDQRLAWIAAEPDRLSIAVLFSGFPAVKLASDGNWLYYLESQNNHNYYKKIPARDGSLKKIIAIPVQVGDVVALLAGRIPVRAHDTVILKQGGSDTQTVLILRKNWRGVVEKIYLEGTGSRLRQIEIFQRGGALAYRAVFDTMRSAGPYQVPARLRLLNEAGSGFQLDVGRYWANVPVSPAMFVLNPVREKQK